ncbi:hypothetical protein L596_002337 [Steinernema carpocapsae]|uniref:Uncharacterized protein n=1 Tax=Steinernema carpocapsae TaxID=34508 RepID=A0A4V6I7D6_STECR|nr:hypothetical protein L596_002337 [Steinernema carpocapsae]
MYSSSRFSTAPATSSCSPRPTTQIKNLRSRDPFAFVSTLSTRNTCVRTFCVFCTKLSVPLRTIGVLHDSRSSGTC